MSNELMDKTTLVTGASKGIGKAIAINVARLEGFVIVNYKSDAKGAESTVEDIKAKGGDAAAVYADVSNYSDVDAMFQEIHRLGKKVDILVNNAGISPVKRFLDYSPKEIRRVIDTNFLGALYCSQKAIIDMQINNWGRIVNISSVHGTATGIGRVPYSAAKGALEAFTRALAVEFGNKNICVNSLIVGGVANKRTLNIAQKENKNFSSAVPNGRWAECDEIAETVLFLIKEKVKYINGANIRIDGGLLSKLHTTQDTFNEQPFPE